MSKAFQTVSGFILFMALIAGSQAWAEENRSATEAGSVESSISKGLLPAPKGVRAIPQVKGVLLKWKSVSGSDGYRIYWAGQGNVTRPRAQVTEVGSGRLQCTLNSLLPGVSYGFKVCAVRSCEEGRLSRQVTATPQGNPRKKSGVSTAVDKASEGDWIDLSEEAAQSSKAVALPPPKGLKATPQVEGALLRWKPVAGSTGYRIYWEKKAHVSSCSNRIADLPADQVNCRLGDLTPGTLYRFRVCTLKASKEGPLSREAGARPKEKIHIRASDAAP